MGSGSAEEFGRMTRLAWIRVIHLASIVAMFGAYVWFLLVPGPLWVTGCQLGLQLVGLSVGCATIREALTGETAE